MWSDDHKRISFLGMTAHYIDGGLLKERILAFYFFYFEPARSLNIEEKFLNILNEFGTDQKCCVFVSDRGANMLAALDSYESKNCIDHVLNNVMETGEHDADFKLIINNCKNLVQFFKQSGKPDYNYNFQNVPHSSLLRCSCMVNYHTSKYIFQNKKLLSVLRTEYFPFLFNCIFYSLKHNFSNIMCNSCSKEFISEFYIAHKNALLNLKTILHNI